MTQDRVTTTTGRDPDTTLDALLAAVHGQVGIAVHDRLMAQGGLPELRDPDLALDRYLAAAHRETGTAVTERLARHERITADPQDTDGMDADPATPLAARPAVIRLKYRQEALRIVDVYWPRDLAAVLRTVLDEVQQLGRGVRDGRGPTAVRLLALRLHRCIADIRVPRELRPRPAALTGTDYLAAVEATLGVHAGQLVADVREVCVMLAEELASLLGSEDEDLSDAADVMIQDVVDDLTRTHGQALTLSRAVGAVVEASSDFTGVDLRHARLDGVPLAGIRWDAATIWPDAWAELIRRASLPEDEDGEVLIVAAEPNDSAVPADT